MQPTQQQIAVWDSFKEVSKRFDLEARCVGLGAKNVVLALEFCKRKNVVPDVPSLRVNDHVSLELTLNEVKQTARAYGTKAERLKRVIDEVELERFGLRFNGGDFDIMAPPGTGGDELAQYQLNGFGWLIYVVGVVVLGGAALWIASWVNKGQEDDMKNTVIQDELDAWLCADQSSDLCKEWSEIKHINHVDQNRNLIDRLRGAYRELPKNVASLASKAATIAVVVGLGWLLVSAHD